MRSRVMARRCVFGAMETMVSPVRDRRCYRWYGQLPAARPAAAAGTSANFRMNACGCIQRNYQRYHNFCSVGNIIRWEPPMLTVTGATGHLGALIVNRLLERVPADRIGVSVRDM